MVLLGWLGWVVVLWAEVECFNRTIVSDVPPELMANVPVLACCSLCPYPWGGGNLGSTQGKSPQSAATSGSISPLPAASHLRSRSAAASSGKHLASRAAT